MYYTSIIQYSVLYCQYNIEKIKTIGDNYFAVAGLQVGGRKSAIDIINMAKEMIETVNNINDDLNAMNVSVRVGIHTGPIVAGVIGKNKFAYDLWGATVNKASRMESSGDKNKIQISSETYNLIRGDFEVSEKRKLDIKGLGTTKTYIIR